MDSSRLLASAMSEDELDDVIREACRVRGLLAYHTHDSRRSEPGFPDWVIVGPGGVIFRECKGYDGRGRLGKYTSAASVQSHAARLDKLGRSFSRTRAAGVQARADWCDGSASAHASSAGLKGATLADLPWAPKSDILDVRAEAPWYLLRCHRLDRDGSC